MEIKGGLLACAVSLFGVYSASAQAAPVDIGTYSFEDSQLVDRVNSVTGGDGFYDGTNLVSGANLMDLAFTPNGITDKDPTSAGATFISTLPSQSTPGADYNGVTIDLGFSSSRTINGTGSDLALFFLFDQINFNVINVTINDVTNTLTSSSFAAVMDLAGTQQVGYNIPWNGETVNDVLLTVAELDLTDFGLVSGATINSLAITMTQDDVVDTIQVATLSLVGSLNTTAVPVPAAVWLFGSGLLGLVGVARRKK